MTLPIPATTPKERVERLVGDATRGETIFYAGGCASCHAAPKSEDKLSLPGGRAFPSPFGTFFAPNISPHADGIAGWSALDLVNAMKHGTSPEGQHYFPAFPYASYARAEDSDIVDLKAFLDTLPPVASEAIPHDIGFPFNIRRTLGLWKLMFVSGAPVLADASSEQIERGRYLAEALGHCGECHTPRNLLGVVNNNLALSGNKNGPVGDSVPNITPGEGGIGDWEHDDIISALEIGLLPDGDFLGGAMTDVIEDNTSKLTAEDLNAIATYLTSLEPIASND